MNMTKNEIEVLKKTMTSLIGNGRDHVNAEWYNITEEEMDKIEDQAKEIIDWYLVSYLKAEGYVNTDYREENEEDTPVDEDVVTEEVIEEEIAIIPGEELNITEEEIKRDYDYERYHGEGNHLEDNYHTMSELYYHRMVLFATICKLAKDKGHNVFRSKQHQDGSMFEGYFIVGIETPEGQYSYHYNLKYWNYFDVADTHEFAPEWDGQQAEDLHRLLSL